MQELKNIEKPCVLFFKKINHINNPTSMSTTLESIWFFKSLCIKGSLMTQFTNFDIEKNLQYVFTSNKMLAIHK